MAGISGTSKTGALHYYYICQKRRTEKACNKQNVRRDEIELAVAQAIKSYALQDDIINWIADSTVEYSRRQIEASHVSILEDELVDNKRSIKNIMTAIEQGIITDSTRGRLMELEAEQSKLVGQIAAARADIITVNREDVVVGLKMFRDDDVMDKKVQAKLFDTFLVAVYLYDDDMKIVFGFSGKKNTVKVPIDATVVDGLGYETGEADCSFKVTSEPPERSQANLGSYKVAYAPPTCIDKKDAGKNPALRCGIFASKARKTG